MKIRTQIQAKALINWLNERANSNMWKLAIKNDYAENKLNDYESVGLSSWYMR